MRPELVAEVKYLTWTGDNLLRQVIYEGLREDKQAAEVAARRRTRNLLRQQLWPLTRRSGAAAEMFYRGRPSK